MLACDGSVTTAWAWANEKRTPAAAIASMLGVRAGPPYELRASPRSVSIVTRSTFCSGFAARMSPRTVARVPQYTAPTTPAAKRTDASARRRRLDASGGEADAASGGLRLLATVRSRPKSWIQSVQVYRNRTQLLLIHRFNTLRLVPRPDDSAVCLFVFARPQVGHPAAQEDV